MLSEITSNHALQDFIRTCQTNAMFNTLESNEICYDKFTKEGYFCVGWDLSVSTKLIVNTNFCN